MSGLLLVKNKSALYDHSLLAKYTAGIVLFGYEVKALREKKAQFDGSYVQLIKGAPYIVNMYIGAYSKNGQAAKAGIDTTRRSRKLLLNASEILEIERELKQKNRTAIPLAIILLNNRIKLEFAVVKGKKEFERKQTAKERQIKRDMDAAFKETRRVNDNG